MPKVSKVKMPSSNKGTVRAALEPDGVYTCTRCGVTHKRQRGNFTTSYSPIYAKNNGYITVCGDCLGTMYKQYIMDLGSEEEAAKRMCMKFDVYWDPALFQSARRTINPNVYSNVFRAYVAKTNLNRYAGKTFDSTLAEEAQRQKDEEARRVKTADNPNLEGGIDPEDVDFWGEGYTAKEYDQLNKKYQRWVGPTEDGAEVSVGTETLYRQICLLEMQISRNMLSGKATEAAINQLNNLLGSANAKPIQQDSDGAGGSFDKLPLGVGIRIFENNRPIPEPLPQLADVDGIVKYISIWFLGHLCKMLHIKNTYCKMYEDEIARLRVDRPDLESEDDETVFNEIFGDNEL